MAPKKNKSATPAAKPTKTGRKPWRPNLALIRQLAARGLTMQQLADCLNVGRSTIFERLKGDPDFLDAVREGQADGLRQVANIVFDLATAGNLQAAQFYLRSRGGWSDRNDTGPVVQQTIAAQNVQVTSHLDEAAQIRAAAAFCRSKGLEVIGD